MTWVKLDDAFTEHPKVDSLSDGAFRLHVAGLCHSARLLTDGFVATERVSRLVPRFSAKALAELVSGRVWHEVEGGYMVHDYLHYNPSREKVLADREAANKRQQSRRASQRDSDGTNGVGSRSPARPVLQESLRASTRRANGETFVPGSGWIKERRASA